MPLVRQDCAYLLHDKWDDWYEYQTQYTLVVATDEGPIVAGSVKIASSGLPGGNTLHPDARTANLPDEFEALGTEFFSVGQDENYYDSLNKLSSLIREDILVCLRDCAYDLSIFDRYAGERVMQSSLLRSVSVGSVRGRLHRLAKGDARLTRFDFEFKLPAFVESAEPPSLTFVVEPESKPPSNIHVLIGRNGVGKTKSLQALARSVLRTEQHSLSSGLITKTTDVFEGDWEFAGLALVSFSIFDQFQLPPQKDSNIRSAHVSLRQQRSDGNVSGLGSAQKMFCDSLDACRKGARRDRWRRTIAALGSDPLFAEAEIWALADMDEHAWRRSSAELFEGLSSGHAIVLLTVTKLVELVDEKTLVLLDEPEGHLHPPLLAAFIRALSDLLLERNGVAIIATHSPRSSAGGAEVLRLEAF